MAKQIMFSLQAILLVLSCASVSSAQVPQVPHVFIVLEGNTDYADVCGPNSTSMPFLCSLKSKGSFSANYYSPTHPSIGNYEDLGWGVIATNDDGCNPDTCGFPYRANNIVRASEAAGKTWKGYAESLPRNCYFGGDNGSYTVGHSPIPYIADVQSNCLNRYVAFEDPNVGFAHDVATNTLPNFAFITPNLCDDGHDCTLPKSFVPDQWLRNNIFEPLINAGHLDPRTGDTVVMIVFDESNSDSSNGGGAVYWFMIGKGVKQNYQSVGPEVAPGFYSHESTLRMVAEMLGASVTGLGGAANAPAMSEFFEASTDVLDFSKSRGSKGIASRIGDSGDGISSVATPRIYEGTAPETASAAVKVQPERRRHISVIISPTSAAVSSGGAQQYTAVVAGASNQAVTWTATAGAISDAGLFTAPIVSTTVTITVTAVSVESPSKTASARVTIEPSTPVPVSIAVSPASASVSSGATRQFTATVSNTANQAVTWTTTAGTISATGLFAAPVVSGNVTITIMAVSIADPSKSASATITVQSSAPAPVSVAISPASASVSSGATKQFTATVSNTANQAVTWTTTAGTISATGLFAAPVVSANATLVVTAASAADPSKSASATVTVQPSAPEPVSIAISPTSASVSSGATKQFTATVSNTSNQAVTWTTTTGAISSAGLFTAPIVSASTTATVTARSVTIPSQSASVAVQILAYTLSPSGPITITGQSGTVVENLHISNPNGDCVVISNSTNVTIRRSEIGPCGGNGIKVSGGNTIGIYDNYIHPEKPLSTSCCDTHDGIFGNTTSNLSIQGNVIAYGESNIEVNNGTIVSVIGNFLLNPIDSDPSQPADGQSRGQNFQAWSNSSQVTVNDNYALSSTDTSKYLFAENQEDSINFGVTSGIVAQGNYITGGHSPSGCGLIADDRAISAEFLNNTLLDTGQCGIGMAGGTNQLVDSNRVLNRTPVAGGGNTAIYVWNQSAGACGPVTVSNNIASEINLGGSQSGFWNGGGCDPVTLSNNTFDAAAQALLGSVSQTMPPPQIPPQPKDCVVASPFTNNTTLPSCSAN